MNFASIAAGAKTSPFTLTDQSSFPSFWSIAITFPSKSETINIPKPAAIPDERKLVSMSQLTLPEEVFIDLMLPELSEANKLSPLNAGINSLNYFHH